MEQSNTEKDKQHKQPYAAQSTIKNLYLSPKLPQKSGTLSDPGSIDTGTMIRHVLKSPTQQHTQHTLHMADPICIVLPYPLLTCTRITK
ncbi:uncharacterized protein Bfra_006853 [Botrytis fragariae]|uniref:Uncharacterized protein n=1 Tax=Botrytis fragariae TaxID=1964551 RepID=A0A8H6EP90_9HELO|nr:uncharacterized protein Bfra_006853 [Botrytis fragariae]KAF5879646.1 hypothetical protein Bfra_006853 [Botrytis fragariae]